MSTVSTVLPLPLIGRQVRVYFAPVIRGSGLPTIFDPSTSAGWSSAVASGVVPTPWVDLGWVSNLVRTSQSKIGEVDAGAPAVAQFQARQTLGAQVSFRFATWSKISMALSTSSQHLNVLAAAVGAMAIGSGAKAQTAAPLAGTSGATKLYLAQGAAFPPGSLVVVDDDYAGQTGYVGACVSAGYIRNAAAVGSDPDAIRRLSWNVGRVAAVGADGGMTLATPLLAGNPGSAMKAQQVVGFVDREGGSFFQEWSALFVLQGVQGDCLYFHYPRLQACVGQKESAVGLAPLVNMLQLDASFRALPVTDGNDGEQILCYRSYVPGVVQAV
jgi:hypothetical protein